MPAWENDAALAVAAASMAAIDHLVARASSFVVLSGGSKLGLPSARTAFEISAAYSNEGHAASFTPRPLGTRPLVR